MENQDATPRQQSPMVEKSETNGQKVGKPVPPLGEFTRNQKRALAVMVVIALGFGAYFLRGYLQLIAIAGVLAYLFRPLYERFERHMKSGFASALTLLCALLIVIVPLSGIVAMAATQIKQMIDNVSEWMAETDVSQLGDRLQTWFAFAAFPAVNSLFFGANRPAHFFQRPLPAGTQLFQSFF